MTLALLAALCLGAGLALSCAVWRGRHRRLETREADTLAARIVPPVYKPGMTTMDDRLRVRSLARRQAADSLKARARSVDSGAPVRPTLRQVK